MKSLKEKMGNKQKRCVYCWTTERITIDHKTPKIRGGSDEKNNLQYACRRCNGYKGDMKHHVFKRLLKTAIKIGKERELRDNKYTH